MSITDSLELPIFPVCPSYGVAVQPQYLVNCVSTEGGFERTDRRWARALRIFTGVPIGDRPEEDIYAILNFWHAMNGMLTTFKIRDWSDYKSCFVGSEITAHDQPIVLVSSSGSGDIYRLVKQYIAGNAVEAREITQPDGDTITVANDFGAVQDPSKWSLDAGTGLLTTISGFSGTPTTWGGEFFVPVRFNSELAVEASNRKIQSVTFTLIEKRIKLSTSGTATPTGEWVARPVITLDDSYLLGVTIGADGKVIVASDTGVFVSADHAISYSRKTVQSGLTCIAYGNSTCIAAGQSDVSDPGSQTTVIISSDNGETWGSLVNVGSLTGMPKAIVNKGDGQWVLITDNSTPGSNSAISIDNGATWTALTGGATAWGNAVIWDGNFFRAVGANGSTGAVWTMTGSAWSEADTEDGAVLNYINYTDDGGTPIYAATLESSNQIAVAFSIDDLGAVDSRTDTTLTDDGTIGMIAAGGNIFAFTFFSVQATQSDYFSGEWATVNLHMGETVDGTPGTSKKARAFAYDSVNGIYYVVGDEGATSVFVPS